MATQWKTTSRSQAVKEVAALLSKVSREAKTVKQITNYQGPDSESIVYDPFYRGRADIMEKLEEIGTRFEFIVSDSNSLQIAAELRAVLSWAELTRPVDDKRITEEERRVDRENEARAVEAEKARNDKFLNLFGKGPDAVIETEGRMCVTLAVNYDNSEIQSDYFDKHASVGPDLLLAMEPITSKQTEALARRVLDRYPALKSLKWEWHKEAWSMGHGYYLMSSSVPMLDDLTTVGTGKTITAFHYEIEFSKWAKRMNPYIDYPGVVEEPEKIDPARDYPEGGGIVVRQNEMKDGVEIRFTMKPMEATLAALKAFGFRWSFKQRIWYAKRNEQTLSFANRLASTSTPTAPVEAGALAVAV